MVRAELCFKPIHCMSKWRRHHSGVCDNDIEGFSLGQQVVSTGPHTGEVPKIQFDQSETTALGCRGVLSNQGACRFGFGQISCSTHKPSMQIVLPKGGNTDPFSASPEPSAAMSPEIGSAASNGRLPLATAANRS